MRNLSIFPNLTPEALFLSIAGSKSSPCRDMLVEKGNGNTDGCIQNRVLDRYKEYQDNCYNLTNVSPVSFSGLEKQCLINCYNSETKASNWLFAEITNVQDTFTKDKCPYCGINSPTTVDHYLPKEDFPEFSVMSHNLVPCCADCNSLKGRKWINHETGMRLFVHFYFDEIPNEVFMKADISMMNNAPTVVFSMCPPNITTNPFYDIISTHYEELNVFNRIEYKVTSYVAEILQINKKG